MAKGRAAKGERVGDERGVGNEHGGVVGHQPNNPLSTTTAPSISLLEQKQEPPAWALELLGGMRRTEERLTKLEAERATSLVGVRLDSGVVYATPAPGNVSTIRARRCEECNGVYEGPELPFGQSGLCDVCKKPGYLPRTCAGCQARYSTDEITAPFMCPKCKGCQVCGDKSQHWVCGICIKKGAFFCDSCFGPAPRNTSKCPACVAKEAAEKAKHQEYKPLEGNWPDHAVSEANPALARV